ncbi:hypothetical protein ACFSUS_25700 [Spirosoma soli]|uniref:Lipocalin-like domain-containing protein n=1 Tax=Spirosoma soli TaxID=1770529 RepID=A0ABW5MES8_9BACT
MMKYAPVYALFFLFVFCTAWKQQNKTDRPTDICKSETKGVITSCELTSMAAGRANFSGEWKLNESESELDRQFPICIFGERDHIVSKTMKIAEHADFLTVEVVNSSSNGALITRQEKLFFDGKESEAIVVGSPREKSTARWSADGQTMTVISVRSFATIAEEPDFKVTEVWKLINDGKSISVQVNPSSISRENTMKLVYDKR